MRENERMVTHKLGWRDPYEENGSLTDRDFWMEVHFPTRLETQIWSNPSLHQWQPAYSRQKLTRELKHEKLRVIISNMTNSS